MIAAGIDCGTNTIKLLVADLDPTTGQEREIVRQSRMVRLGQGVDASGRLADEALERVFGAVEEYADIIERHDVAAVRFCATSAVRDSGNADVFVSGVEQRLGATPEVLSGSEEAQLSFSGATRRLTQAEPPVLVVDIGGGSTELVLGGGHGDVQAAHSLDIGSVRLTERLLTSDPPTADQVSAVREHVDEALDTLPSHGVDLRLARTVVAVSGTGLTVVAGALSLPALDREAVDRRSVRVEHVADFVRDLVAMTVEQRRALPYMQSGRADVIGAGALILERVLARVPVPEMSAAVSDILDGITWSAVEA